MIYQTALECWAWGLLGSGIPPGFLPIRFTFRHWCLLGACTHGLFTYAPPQVCGDSQRIFPGVPHLDPMFAINQRCASLRADVNRLIRRSWCTTKKSNHLHKHLMIYSCYNNGVNLKVLRLVRKSSLAPFGEGGLGFDG